MINNFTPDYKPVLNRKALLQLRRSGLEELANGLTDMLAVRNFAMWCKQSGGQTSLFNLLVVTSRLTATHYLNSLDIIAGADSLEISGVKEIFSGLDESCKAYLENYPRGDFLSAWRLMQPEIRGKLIAEMFLLKALNDNPSTNSFNDLFDDCEFVRETNYVALLQEIDSHIRSCPGSREHGQKGLIDILREPIKNSPHSLSGQIAYIRHHWSAWLPNNLLREIAVAQAVYTEEMAPRLHGPGPTQMPLLGRDDGSDVPAAFTDDTDWMSSAVMLAKSIFVWLDQLSQRYQREVTTLAEIPDAELANLSRQGFNALWLIGIWERSKASRTIKQLCGNPEAVASAYSLHAYRVAEELGGEQALAELENRCSAYGIRLACDVVPNHTGIDSEWVIRHPDWFIQTDHPPYPAYRFSGPDLCEAEGVSIRVEDGYWDNSDAAVVCEHHEHHSGKRRYIYHGNDGTHMPWNDTAQLNFLLPDVRSAMSDLIVSVAKRFRLIRFDAAMTLARKHYRRLWFPPPGDSAGVPSRSEAWMSDEDFNHVFPTEFWREVVDRINREAPDTLLIAEAFWLMESYFVRNLGMHRVYNSAFMNMLKREENAKYRKVLKDILAYNPEILKRYVNFMNNPDEATAVEQFGKGDKYFGVATLLATLPGLPMFGHGQVEGYREKYGMEYRRAYWEEQPDEGFISHHEQQIFPLLRNRNVFSGVHNFSLYDFETTKGVDENIFAFSNGPEERKTLVIFNNSPHSVQGFIHQAAPKANTEREGKALEMPPLWQELNLDRTEASYFRYRNLQGNEFLYPIEKIKAGMEIQLEAYDHQVFTNFQLLTDGNNVWHDLFQKFHGQPIPDLDRAKQQHQYSEIWEAFVQLLRLDRLQNLSEVLSTDPPQSSAKNLIRELSADFDLLVNLFHEAPDLDISVDSGNELLTLLESLSDWLEHLSTCPFPEALLSEMWHGGLDSQRLGAPLLAWLLLHQLGQVMGHENDQESLNLFQVYGLDYAWQQQANDEEEQRAVLLTFLLMKKSTEDAATNNVAFAEICQNTENRHLLGINSYDDSRWFNREGMHTLAGAIALQAALKAQQLETTSVHIEEIADVLRQRLARAVAVGYQLDKFLLIG